MNISEAAEKSGLTAVTLRYYERIGLIPPVTRGNGGVRLYKESILVGSVHQVHAQCQDVDRILDRIHHFVRSGKDTSLEEILIEEQKKMEERYNELGKTLEKLNKKIEHYEARIIANQKVDEDITVISSRSGYIDAEADFLA